MQFQVKSQLQFAISLFLHRSSRVALHSLVGLSSIEIIAAMRVNSVLAGAMVLLSMLVAHSQAAPIESIDITGRSGTGDSSAADWKRSGTGDSSAADWKRSGTGDSSAADWRRSTTGA